MVPALQTSTNNRTRPTLAELLFKQRLQFVHAERGAFQILRIGIVSKNVRAFAAWHFHGAVSCDQDHHGIVLAGAALQKILETVPYRGCGSFLVGEQHDVVARDASP